MRLLPGSWTLELHLLPGSWTLEAVQQALIKQAVEAGHSGQQGIFLPGSWTLEAVQQQVLLLPVGWTLEAVQQAVFLPSILTLCTAALSAK